MITIVNSKHTNKLFLYILPSFNFSLGNSHRLSYGSSSACSSIPKSGFQLSTAPFSKCNKPARANSFFNFYNNTLKIFNETNILCYIIYNNKCTCSLLKCVAQAIIRIPKSMVNTEQKAMKPKCSCSMGLSVNNIFFLYTTKNNQNNFNKTKNY